MQAAGLGPAPGPPEAKPIGIRLVTPTFRGSAFQLDLS